MDLEILKKKLSTFKTDGGYLKNVNNDVLVELLTVWENWSGTATKFYTAIGTSSKRVAVLLGKAKKLKREGYGTSEFEEITPQTTDIKTTSNCPIELQWGEIPIRFGEVDLLVDFLKKVA